MSDVVKFSALPLHEICLNKLLYMIIDALRHGTSLPRNINEVFQYIPSVQIRKYLKHVGATPQIFQDLLWNTLDICWDNQLLFLCLELFLHNTTAYLSKKYLVAPFPDMLGKLICLRGSGLQELIIDGIFFEHNDMPILYDIIKNCRNLRRFVLLHKADDTLLKTISDYCPKLKKLEVCQHFGDSHITAYGFLHLSTGITRDNIVILNIGKPHPNAVSAQDVAALLEYCPNLMHLNVLHYMGKALKYLDRKYKNYQCNLLYIHDFHENMYIILKTCPHLHKLYFCKSKICDWCRLVQEEHKYHDGRIIRVTHDYLCKTSLIQNCDLVENHCNLF